MQTSALTGFRPVPRVRIHSSPPRSLDCREIPQTLPRKTRTMPVFRDIPHANRTAENGLLSIKYGQYPDFSPEGIFAVRFSSRALGECNAITSLVFGPSESTFASTLENEAGNRRHLSAFCATDGQSAGRLLR